MERIIRVVLFLALAGLGLDHARTQHQLDAFKPPPRLRNELHALLHRNPFPPPPPPSLGAPKFVLSP